MKRLFFSLMALLLVLELKANDGAFYVNGSTLVPVKETDISISKEILTITIGDDDYATVDVYYEFFNPKSTKTITMAFEANPPGDWNPVPFNRNGVHPFIKDFSVTMNGTALPHSNMVIQKDYKKEQDFEPFDLNGWKGYGDTILYKGEYITSYSEEDGIFMDGGNLLYSEKLDSFAHFAYGYFFKATFKEGLNTVHHTYRYRTSYVNTSKYEFIYWLTPASRWAGGKIGDFTLRLMAQSPRTEIYMENCLFDGQHWSGSPDQYLITWSEYVNRHYVLAELYPNKVLEWHKTDFVPSKDFVIYSPEYNQPDPFFAVWDVVVDETNGDVYLYAGQDDDHYFTFADGCYGEVAKSTSHVESFYNREEHVIRDKDSIIIASKEQSKIAVDLGLSVKWAAWNIGAEKPEESGNYYAWGETSTKKSYGTNYFDREFRKYNRKRKTVLDLYDDVANSRWGGGWRIPTKDEIQELVDRCNWKWTRQNGVLGYLITGPVPNRNSIFLPITGMKLDTRLLYSDTSAYYWSSSLGTTSDESAWQLYFKSNEIKIVNLVRNAGRAIRPVYPKDK